MQFPSFWVKIFFFNFLKNVILQFGPFLLSMPHILIILFLLKMNSQYNFLNIPIYTTQQVNDIAEYYNNIIYNLLKNIDQLKERLEKLKTAEEKKRPTMNQLSEFFIENLTKFLSLFIYF